MNKDALKEACKSLINKEECPIETSFDEIDYFLSGVKKGSLITIGARPSMGKTTFAMTLAENFLKKSKKCLYFSLDMPLNKFMQRMIVQYAQINASTKPSDEDTAKLNFVKDVLGELDFLVNDKADITIEEIESQIDEYKPDYVFIDYIQLIRHSEDNLKVGANCNIIRKLKTVAKEKDVTIFVLSQLFRSLENRKNRRPVLTDLKDCSGAIEEASDVVIFLYREWYYSCECAELKERAEIIFAKNNSGQTGVACLKFKQEIPKFFAADANV